MANNEEKLEIIEGDKENGIVGIFVKDKLVKRVPYKAGKVEGTMEVFDAKGKVVETLEYVEGKRNGRHIKYYKNKVILEEQYEDDKLDGKVITYYNNGAIESITQYKDGKQEGELLVYDRRGNLIHNSEHSDGYISVGSRRTYDRHERINEFDDFDH